MLRKIGSILIVCVIVNFVGGISASFGLDKAVDKINVKLISPDLPNTKLSKVKADTNPVVISGIVPVEIDKAVKNKDVENQRYLVEYFIDGNLAYTTDGSDEEHPKNNAFTWMLDTTKYKNGKHKLVVNFWDKEGESSIGIVYVVIKNPMSIEQIKRVTSDD